MEVAHQHVTVLVIGDEVLSAKVKDANGPFLLERLAAVGARVREVRVIGDDPDAIEGAVNEAMARGDRVITTGGIGPTHDDRTVSSVATALGVPVVENQTILKKLSDHLGGEIPEALRRLARVPEGSSVVVASGFLPTVVAGPVTMLPGVPALVRMQFERLERSFAGAKRPCGALFTDRREDQIANILEGLLADDAALVIGSYPRLMSTEFAVIVTIEHDRALRVDEALDALTSSIGADHIVHREHPFLGLRDAVATAEA